MVIVLPTPPGVEAPDANLGTKAFGLLELDALGVPVPEALIVPAGYAHVYATAAASERAALLDWIVDALVAFVARLDAPLPLVSFRCAAKSGGGGKALPESVLNVGANRATLHASSRGFTAAFLAELEHGLLAHAQQFYRFFGAELPAAFADAPLDEQLRMLLARIYDHAPARGEVVVQRMVFGNLDERSLTGMCYTRHPHTGARIDYGHFILHRQGMSLGGTSSPDQLDLSVMPRHNPAAYAQLRTICRRLESHYGDVRALEYTAEGERLFILQNTVGKRTFRLASARGSS